MTGLRDMRIGTGMEAKSLCSGLGVCHKTLQKYESDPGTMRIATANAYSELTGIPLCDILMLSDLNESQDVEEDDGEE